MIRTWRTNHHTSCTGSGGCASCSGSGGCTSHTGSDGHNSRSGSDDSYIYIHGELTPTLTQPIRLEH